MRDDFVFQRLASVAVLVAALVVPCHSHSSRFDVNLPARGVPIDGTIVVKDLGGVEHAEEDGTLTPAFRPT
jgi:hypothetical protein